MGPPQDRHWATAAPARSCAAGTAKTPPAPAPPVSIRIPRSRQVLDRSVTLRSVDDSPAYMTAPAFLTRHSYSGCGPRCDADPGVVEVRVAVLRLDLAVWQARGVTHPSQGGGPPTMSASHSKELPGTVSELVGRRLRIVPGVGLVDRDVNDHAQHQADQRLLPPRCRSITVQSAARPAETGKVVTHMSVWARLRYRQEASGPAAVAVVGAGWVGRGLIWRLTATPGLTPALVVSRRPDAGVAALVASGHSAVNILVSEDPDALSEAVRTGRPAVTASASAAAAVDGIDVVVEATGAIDFGATVVLDALAGGRHVVSINAEAEATVGYLMHTVARENGVVYTFADGDQPGVLLRQLDFIEGLGFQPVAAVNCKRHLDVHQTPAAGLEFQRRDGTSPAITTSAGDGTKMHVENAVVANVRGMPPDCRGMHGVRRH